MLTSLKAHLARAAIRRQENDSNLNQANVALSAGNFELASSFANNVLSSKWSSKNARLAAIFLMIRVRSRQGHFSGVLDDLEALLEKVPRSNSNLQARIGNEIVWACFRSGNLGIGTQRGEAFYSEHKNDWPKVELVELLCQLSGCHFHRGDTNRAEEIVVIALDLAQSAKSAKGLTQSYWQSSFLNDINGDLQLALEQNNQAKAWAQIAEMKNVIPILNSNAAIIMLDLPDANLSQIEELAEAAYLELSVQNSLGGTSYVCQILSEVELRREDFERALMFANKGLQELPPEVPGPKASLLVQVAKVYARMGNYAESETHLGVAAEHMEQLDPSKELAKQWGDMARVYVEVGLTDRGVYAYEKAIQMSGLLREEQESRVN